MDKIARSPWLLAGLFLLAALIGAGAIVGYQRFVPGAVDAGDKAKVERVVHDYVLEHPEIIPEAMDRLRERETGKVVAANRGAIVTPYAGAWMGNPKGDVTVVAYMDYACGYCRASLPAIATLLEKDPNVRVVYREYPILSDESVTAARWALAAAEQNRFKPFHDALYAAGQLSEAAIQAAAAKAGLDKAQAEAAIKAPRVEAELRTNHQMASQLNVSGTPSWVIGDQVVYGALGYDQLAEAVAKARKKG